ncbi:MAG: transglycosylase domain-containing protein [Clostridia bacterium]|nr:transglycosylase domain-containing protein [Clostridia bacterium]
MQQGKPRLFQNVRIAAKLIRENGMDRFRFADDGIIDPLGQVRDRSGLDRRVMFGRIGGSLFRIENRREYIPLSEVPEAVRRAFVDYEDARFFRHRGYDLRGLLRALANNLAGRRLQGGSTITMQLAKMLFLYHYERRMKDKLAQLYLAVLLERHLTKDEILELYLNSLYFANRIYGLEAAARFYLDKSARDISLSECLYLGAVSQRPARLDPLKAPEETEHFRQQRLNYFLRNGLITEEQYRESIRDVPVLRVRKESRPAPARFDEVYSVPFDAASGRFGEDGQLIFERLREAGFSVPVIAGIMGNLYVESLFRADAGIRSGSCGAAGLAQWAGERLRSLINAWPDDWHTAGRQMDFLFSEFGAGGGRKDERAAKFYSLALADGSGAPEYWSDVFQALVERNISAGAYAEEISTNTASGRVTFRNRLPAKPNEYDGRYYLDADRRRNYAKILAYCIGMMKESGERHDGE